MAGVTAALFKRPGWWRALTYTIIAGAFGLALVVVLRKVSGLPAFQTVQTLMAYQVDLLNDLRTFRRAFAF